MQSIQNLIACSADACRAASGHLVTLAALDEELGGDRAEQFEAVYGRFLRILASLVALAGDESAPVAIRKGAAQASITVDAGLAPSLRNIIQKLWQTERHFGAVRLQGYDAAKAGQSWRDNPFERGAEEYAEWERGWCSGDNRDPKTWLPLRQLFAAQRAAAGP
jgi:hypothetical protein